MSVFEKLSVSGGSVTGGSVEGATVKAIGCGVNAGDGIEVKSTGVVSGTGGDMHSDRTDNTEIISYGVSASTPGGGTALDVSGSGAVIGIGGNVTSSSEDKDAKNKSYGVYASGGDVNVSGGTLSGTGGDITNEDIGNLSCGILSKTDLKVTGGTVFGEGGATTATDNKKISRGVRTESALTVSGGSLEGRGGTAYNSFGVDSIGAMTVKGTGILKGTGGSALNGGASFGVNPNGKLTVSGGSLEGTGGEAAGNNGASYGVYGNGNALTAIDVSGGSLTGKGGHGGNNSHGVLAVGTVTVSGGSLEGTGGTADHADSRGVLVATGALSISGGSLKGTGGAGGAASTNGSIGVEADDNISISSGSLTGVGNNSAFNKQPHSLPSAGYFHRSSNTTTPPSNFTSSTTAAYVWNAGQKYAEIRDKEMPAVALTGGSATFPVGKASADAVFSIGANLPISSFSVTLNYEKTMMGAADLTTSQVSAAEPWITLTFKRDYLNTLPVGTHTATVYLQEDPFEGATVPIQLVATAAPSPAPSSPGRANPSTGV